MPRFSKSAFPLVDRVGAEESLWFRISEALTFRLISRRPAVLLSFEGDVEDGGRSSPMAGSSV